MGTDPDHGRVR